MSEKLNLRNDQIQMRLTVNGALDRTIVDFKSGTVTVNMQKLRERYVGRTSNSLDEIYEDTDLSLVCHPRSQDFLRLFQLLVKRAQRAIPQTEVVVNGIITLEFSDLGRPKIVLPDLKFGNLPLNLPSEGYADFTLDGTSEKFLPIFT
jgi:hypothetical protein